MEDQYENWLGGAASRMRFINSGALAIAFVSVTQFLQLDELDTPLTISLYCFAVALPLTAAAAALLALSPYATATVDLGLAKIEAGGHVLALVASFAGMVGVFWHFSWGAGVVFLVIGWSAYGY